MSDDLLTRGIHILGELAKAWDEKAWSAVKAWERNCISAYPDLEYLGPITPDERTYAEGLVQQQAPDFTITHPSTYFLDAETIEATAFTNAVRLHRLQQPEVIGHAADTLPKPFTFWTDAEKAYSKRVIDIRAVKRRAPTEREDIVWAEGHDMTRTRLRWLRKNCPERTAKDRRIGNPARK